jgi:molecular chaperone GrpE
MAAMEEKQTSQNRPQSEAEPTVETNGNGSQPSAYAPGADALNGARAGAPDANTANPPDTDASSTVLDDANDANGAESAEAAALAQAQAKIAEMHESFMRARAETENVRRRAHEDVQKAHKFAIETFAEHLLPVLDSLEAAAADQSGDLAKVREGIELTLRQMTSALEKGRVRQLNPVGEKFDPHLHQAISMVPADQEPNTVVAVLQKGYVIAERVLRPALVTVAAPK